MIIRKTLVAGLAALSLVISGCAPMLSGILTGSTTPPQLPSQVQTISRAALNFAFTTFDAALYGFDFAMDLGKPAPGSDKAKAIAAAGRKVLGFLNAAEAARRAGNAASYEEAFAQAHSAMKQFKDLLGVSAPHAGLMQLTPLKPVDRMAVLDRASV